MLTTCCCKDEPTSGLDSQTAWSICQLLRKLADQGQAVLCTIHQPSSQLFQMFDRLLLLNDHGEVAYFGDIGEAASLLIDYFESRGAPRCQADVNPAEWVLSVVSSMRPGSPAQNPSGTVKQALVEQVQHVNVSSWSTKWAESQQHREVQQHNLRLSSAVGEPASPNMLSSRLGGSEYATSFSQQLYIVTKRIFLEYWRDPTYVYSKLALCWGVVGTILC
jgi:ATP-binding cassette, subfamily G (WHITE), member 2, PDR